MRIPLSILFSDDNEGSQAKRKALLAANPVTGVTEKTHWKDLKADQKDALYKAYYSTAEQKEVTKTQLNDISAEKPDDPKTFDKTVAVIGP